MDIEFIKRLVCEFRQALEIVVDKKLYGRLLIFNNFPKECCRYTSDLLATYLMNVSISRERIQLLESTSYKEEYTHCWLMIDEKLFIDITADQFNGKSYFKMYEPIPACCIVLRDTYLYECFNRRKTHYLRNVGIDNYVGDVTMKLKVVYDETIKQIEKLNKER